MVWSWSEVGFRTYLAQIHKDISTENWAENAIFTRCAKQRLPFQSISLRYMQSSLWWCSLIFGLAQYSKHNTMKVTILTYLNCFYDVFMIAASGDQRPDDICVLYILYINCKIDRGSCPTYIFGWTRVCTETFFSELPRGGTGFSNRNFFEKSFERCYCFPKYLL